MKGGKNVLLYPFGHRSLILLQPIKEAINIERILKKKLLNILASATAGVL
jgi:hypothetical protein